VNGEVRGLAVDCLGELTRKIEHGPQVMIKPICSLSVLVFAFQFRPIVTTLMANMASDKSDLLEISALALRTVAERSSARVANECLSSVVPKLCEMIGCVML